MGRLKITRLCQCCQKPFRPWGGNHPGLFCSNTCRGISQFWSEVNKSDGCWEWAGDRDRDGYGRFSKGQRAHRYSWVLHFAPIPKGLCVLHRCDNPSCVRPEHLFLGTNADNTADKVAKGRAQRGEQHGMAKLSELDIRRIRARYKEGGISQSLLASHYNVDQTMISAIVNYRNWKHIE